MPAIGGTACAISLGANGDLGATRAFGLGHHDLPPDLRVVKQLVSMLGSMDTASWVLWDQVDNPAFDSAAHGAGRVMSRKKAKAEQSGIEVRLRLKDDGISVRLGSVKLLSEEARYPYKDVDAVAAGCDRVKFAAKVAPLRPVSVVKG